MPSPRALRGDERIRNIHDEAKAHRWIARHAHFRGYIEGFLAGIGLSVVVVLIYAHRHGWLY